MSLRFIHGADFHLDSPFDGLSEEQAARRRREQRELLGRLAELVRREAAQLLLLSGDLLDSTNAYGETVACLRDFFRSVTIPIFISPGNHDCVSRLSPYLRMELPENVHLFRSSVIECVELPALNLRVWGAGYTDNHCPPLLRGFEAAKDGEVLDIMVLHGEVGKPTSPYCPITEQELARSGMDYVALGHNHTFSGLRRAEDCFYAWPGCMEGRGFDECGEKGVLVGELAPGECTVRFVPMGGRRYESRTVSLAGDPLSSVLAVLPEDTQRDIYRIVLTGECDSAPDLAVLHEALSPSFFALTLRDATEPRMDIWARMGENTLRGYFLQRMRRRLDQTEDPAQRRELLLAVRAGLAALDGREEAF